MNTLVTLHVSTSQTWLTISALLVGVLTPAVVAIINHPVWEPQAKRIIAVASAAVLGILTVIANGLFTDFEVTIPNVVTVVLAVIGASQTAYALFWKPTGAADTIETDINPGPPVPVPPPITGTLSTATTIPMSAPSVTVGPNATVVEPPPEGEVAPEAPTFEPGEPPDGDPSRL